MPLVHFINGGLRCSFPRLAVHMPMTSRGNEVIYLTRTFQKMKANMVRSPKPFVPPIEDGSSRVKIPGIDASILVTPIPTIPIQSIAPLPWVTNDIKENFESSPAEMTSYPSEFMSQVPKSNGVNFKEELAHVLPSGSQCFPSIGRIPSFGKNLFDSGSRLDGLKGVCSPDDGEVEANAPSLVPHPQHPLRAPQGGISIFNAITIMKEVDKNAARVFGKAILDKVSRFPFYGLPSLKGDFDNLYATIL
ncbi:hypothetical protein Cgig2_006798 [Carnegiea gigantea]|uniref:Uncharacterized protein n=1 Tax=Carnegiea gigantea TaxID=171969 RepID=A0A9Q1JP73_9CARY|nr:hypothetical protein Cgig2_006798 [Carnegiea gigantea]